MEDVSEEALPRHSKRRALPDDNIEAKMEDEEQLIDLQPIPQSVKQPQS